MADNVKIKENSDWYYANQDDLVSRFKCKFIAISDCGVVGHMTPSAVGFTR